MREKLIDVFMHLDRHIRNMYEYGICYTSDFAEAVETVLAMLKNQDAHGVTVQKWISVKDRLPNKATEYLCRCIVNDDNTYPFYMVLRYILFDKNPHFQHETKGGMKVSHWMPLPEPPKGE